MEAKAIRKRLQKNIKNDAQREPKLVPKGALKWSQIVNNDALEAPCFKDGSRVASRAPQDRLYKGFEDDHTPTTEPRETDFKEQISSNFNPPYPVSSAFNPNNSPTSSYQSLPSSNRRLNIVTTLFPENDDPENTRCHQKLSLATNSTVKHTRRTLG